MATSKKKSRANIQSFLSSGGTQEQLGNYGKRLSSNEFRRLLGQRAAPTASAAPAAPINPLYSNYTSSPQLEALQKQYTESLAPGAGETEASTQLQNIITSKELGVAKSEAEPMAQGFVTGQSAALEKSAALKSLPLQTKLANLQAQRQSAADVLKTSLGFETEKLGAQRSAYESEAALAEQRREFNQNLSFDRLKYGKQLKLSKKERKAERERVRIQQYQYDQSQKLEEEKLAWQRQYQQGLLDSRGGA
jgi:hypothetical protein